jgi:hypothetical protein
MFSVRTRSGSLRGQVSKINIVNSFFLYKILSCRGRCGLKMKMNFLELHTAKSDIKKRLIRETLWFKIKFNFET